MHGTEDLEKNIDNIIAIHTIQKGLHLDNEISKVFETAIYEFKIFFSYLLLCEFKLQNTLNDKFKINTKDLSFNTWNNRKSKGFQSYYIKKVNDSKTLSINTKYLDSYISNKKITLNEDGLQKIKSECSFDIFKKVFKEKNSNAVSQKIIRAMDWFLQANLEDDITDSVIKYFIALESLFSTGFSGLNSKTICDNVAMICDYEIQGRLKYTKMFSDLLNWRNQIIHHGKSFEDNPNCYKDLKQLKIGITWSIFVTIYLYDKICALGKNGDSINKYFNNRRLAASII